MPSLKTDECCGTVPTSQLGTGLILGTLSPGAWLLGCWHSLGRAELVPGQRELLWGSPGPLWGQADLLLNKLPFPAWLQPLPIPTALPRRPRAVLDTSSPCGPDHRSKSWPSLGSPQSPGMCLMPWAGCPVPGWQEGQALAIGIPNPRKGPGGSGEQVLFNSPEHSRSFLFLILNEWASSGET